jgi:peptide/nickel transport system permease protein
VIFSVWTHWWWFPSIYDTTHVVDDWDSFVFQLKQMVMPMMVLASADTAQISRYMRASMLDNLNRIMCAPPAPRAWANAWWCCATSCATR